MRRRSAGHDGASRHVFSIVKAVRIERHHKELRQARFGTRTLSMMNACTLPARGDIARQRKGALSFCYQLLTRCFSWRAKQWGVSSLALARPTGLA